MTVNNWAFKIATSFQISFKACMYDCSTRILTSNVIFMLRLKIFQMTYVQLQCSTLLIEFKRIIAYIDISAFIDCINLCINCLSLPEIFRFFLKNPLPHIQFLSFFFIHSIILLLIVCHERLHTHKHEYLHNLY